jgi:hypothetical protein
VTGTTSHLLDHVPRVARGRVRAALGALAVAVGCSIAVAAPAQADAAGRDGSSSWASVFDALRPIPASDTRRVVVTFQAPSLGEWAAAGRHGLTDREQRRYVKRARIEQNRILDQIGKAGVQYELQHRYLRVLNGVSLVVHGDNAQAIRSVRGVRSVSMVRAVYPAAASAEKATAAGAGVAYSADGSAYPTVAVLDTGIDFNHPELTERQAGPGYDFIAGAAGVEAGDDDEHGTQVAGAALAGAGGRVNLLPVRILDRQPVLAGLEYAVDPNADGSVADRADVALAAVSEPYAGFSGAPEERAVAGAAALGTLTVAAAGNDGASGDAVGTVGGPAAADQALAVGAADLRQTVPSAVVHARGGLLDDSFDDVPLLTRSTTVPEGELPLVVIEGSGSDVVDYLGDDARSRVGGAVALLQQSEGVTLADQVRAAADAGAAAVLISGADSGELAGVIADNGTDVPAFGISTDAAATLAQATGSAPVKIGFEIDDTASNPAAGRVAGFSSRGPRYDGLGKPDVVAPGVAVRTPTAGAQYAHVSGTSVAAGYAAGAAASLRAAHRDWTPQQVRAALISSAALLGPSDDREAVEAQGAGLIDVRAAAGSHVSVTPVRVDFGALTPGTTNRVRMAFRGANGALLSMPSLAAETSGDHDLVPSVDAQGYLTVTVPDGTASGVYGGWLVDERDAIRIPWTVSVRQVEEFDVPLTLGISDSSFAPAAGPGTFPSKVTLAVGGSATGGSLGLRAAQRLELTLSDAKGRPIGTLGAFDHVLPGVYSLGLTGLDRAGGKLAPGSYSLRVRSISAAAPTAPWSTGPSVSFTITK